MVKRVNPDDLMQVVGAITAASSQISDAISACKDEHERGLLKAQVELFDVLIPTLKGCSLYIRELEGR